MKTFYEAIYEWVAENYGQSEADNPSWSIEALADHLSKTDIKPDELNSTTKVQAYDRLKEHYLEEDIESVNLSDRIPITPTVALGYMLFVLIYFPCVATLTAIKQESGSWKWAVFAALYTTALAWVVAFAVNVIGKMI